VDIAEFPGSELAVGEFTGPDGELAGANGDNDRGGLNGNLALLQIELKAKNTGPISRLYKVTLPRTYHRRR
jgi:hypothetical protein